jgi:hypothetical protein
MFKKTLIASAVLAITATGSASAATVWNVNIGGGIGSGQSYEITTLDNYVGAATENTASSTWNAVSSSTTATLADSTGSISAGVTIGITEAVGSSVGFQNQAGTVGDEVFKSYIKNNFDPYTVTFGSLDSGSTYDLVIYSGWKFGPDAVGVSQTAGTGLVGIFVINSLDMELGNALATGLAQDTNAANVASDTNYARLNGLSTDGSGNLSFSIGGANGTGGVDGPINGFQLILVPEPSSLALLCLGGVLIARRRRG